MRSGASQTLRLEPSPTGGAGIADRRPQKENNDLQSFSDSSKLVGARAGEELVPLLQAVFLFQGPGSDACLAQG